MDEFVFSLHMACAAYPFRLLLNNAAVDSRTGVACRIRPLFH